MTVEQGQREILKSLQELRNCTVCPRECHTDRTTNELGYCQTGNGFSIGSICVHRGEEPVLTGKHGICNVFFTRCNMQCIYCQNYQISRNHGKISEKRLTLGGVVSQIERVLNHGATVVGFVSASHCIPQMKAVITGLHQRGHDPTFVMNTNAYDKVETLASLEGVIDVYLPDLKYMDEGLAASYSDTPAYPKVATRALKEMYRQMGTEIELDREGMIRSGLIVRHLVLPGQVENSKACLQFIAEEISSSVYLSLMSQYHPTSQVASHPELGRFLLREEYEEVLREMDRLGFHRGWTQKLESQANYLPDFTLPQPFE